MKKQKETLIETKQETWREKKRWLHIALANISEFWSSRAPLGDNVCGLNLTKANVLLCAKSVESNSPGYCYQSFKCDLLDELGHRYSTIEEEQTIFLWKSCELFVDDADEKKREEEEKEEEGEEDNKRITPHNSIPLCVRNTNSTHHRKTTVFEARVIEHLKTCDTGIAA